jgi:heme-degrading monooxygenase HmoA
MSQETIVHIGTLFAKPEYTDDLIKSFEGLKQAPGYISHECYRDIEDQNKLTLVERWDSKNDHENFVNSFPKEVMEQWLNMLSQESEDSYYQEV